jgi:hypothetical protein
MTQPAPSLLHTLTDAWNRAKAAEQEANRQRLAVESQILEAVEVKDSGTTTLETGLKIVTGLTETLDQDAAWEVFRAWPENIPFPLKKQFALDKKALDFCREHYPEQVRKIDACITAKPKKPSFSFKGE